MILLYSALTEISRNVSIENGSGRVEREISDKTGPTQINSPLFKDPSRVDLSSWTESIYSVWDRYQMVTNGCKWWPM